MDKMKISIVTVCLNSVDTIAKTIESVLNQTYENLEYVIVDGVSTDGTLDVIKEYESNTKLKIFSEKDNGLYCAMNKGIDLCTGSYILFLNSGDVLNNKTVLADAARQMLEEKTMTKVGKGEILPAIFYGNVVRVYEGEQIVEKYAGKHVVFRLLMMGRMPCHQSIFASKQLMQEYRFDESYRICADFDFLVRCLHNHISMRHLDMIVSVVDCVMGISSQSDNLNRMRAEDDKSILKNYPIMYYLMWLPKKVIRCFK